MIAPYLSHVANRYCDINWYVSTKVHKFHNFMLIISGKGISITDGKEYPITSGMLIYHHPKQSFGFKTSKTNLMHCFGVNFYISSSSYTLGNWKCSNIGRLPLDNFIKIPNMNMLVKYFTDLSTIWDESRKNYQIKCSSIFLNILYEIFSQTMEERQDTKAARDMDLVTTYIKKYYNKPIALKTLANLIDLSPNYFGSVFKKYTGQTPTNYINSIRIEKSLQYLEIGYTITETALIVGFNDPFYFSKVFKKFKGICPKQYKKSPFNYY